MGIEESAVASVPVRGPRTQAGHPGADEHHLPGTQFRDRMRNAAAVPIRWLSYWSGSGLRQSRAIVRPRILMYHALGVEGLSVRRLRWQFQLMRKEFEPVPLGTLVSRLQEETTTGREIALTFDDGARNHFTRVWPLLREYGIPATFFVCPGLIETNAWMWTAELRSRLNMLDDARRKRIAREADCPARSTHAIMEWAKRLPIHDRLAFQASVEAHTRHFSPSAEEIERYAPLSWDQLRQLDPRLITIGSHTSTHPILTKLPEHQLHEEIADSRKTLEQRLDRTIDLFSYPNGINNSAVVDVVREHYRAAVSAAEGVVARNDDLHTLPRIPGGGSSADFIRRLHRPAA